VLCLIAVPLTLGENPFAVKINNNNSTLLPSQYYKLMHCANGNKNSSISGSAALCWTLPAFFSFLILYTIGRTPRTGDQPVARPLSTQKTTQTQNKRTKTSMLRVGLEPTIPAFERAKPVQRGHCDQRNMRI
jgi:hypothetical protein